MSEFYQLFKVIIATVIFDLRRTFFSKNKGVAEFSGIRIEPGFLAESDVDNLYAIINNIVNDKNVNSGEAIFQLRGEGGHDEGMLDIKHIDKIIPDFSNKIKIEKILDILNDELGQKLRVLNINCYWNQGVQHTRGFHADSHTKEQYKAFIYLTDVVDDLDGPYCYIPWSQLPSLYRYKCIISNYMNNKPLTDYNSCNNQEIIKAKAPKGSLIISNQNGAHRGWPQGENNKRALISINLI